MADANESEAISADADGLSTLAKDASALSAANVTLAEYSVPAVDENGAWANEAIPNIIRPQALVYYPRPATSDTLGSLCWRGRRG